MSDEEFLDDETNLEYQAASNYCLTIFTRDWLEPVQDYSMTEELSLINPEF